MPAIVISNLTWPRRVVHSGPFEHCSSLALIESTFGLTPLTARDQNARNLQELLLPFPVPFKVPPASIPTSSQVIGPAISAPSESLLQVLTGTAEFDPAAVCSADSVQSVSPPPLKVPSQPWTSGTGPGLAGTAGMAAMNRHHRAQQAKRA